MDAKDWIANCHEGLRPYAEKNEPTVAAMLAGSRTAAIKLHCTECMGGQRHEVKRCESNACPLFFYRPGSRPPNQAKREAPKGGFKKADACGDEEE